MYVWLEFNVPPDVNAVLNLSVPQKRGRYNNLSFSRTEFEFLGVFLAYSPVCKRNKTGSVRIT
jgi:hypothetical protein